MMAGYIQSTALAICWLVSSSLANGQQATTPARESKPARKPSSASPLSPREALASFRLQPGFAIQLVASEPLIRDPVAIDFDRQGRMYVVEFPEFNAYSFPRQAKVGGTVKRLEDTDGDGRFDKASTFLAKVAFPTAIACYDDGVFVGAAPDILYCKDTDGDGRADIRRVVMTGFARDFAGGGLINSFRWGIDNRIHIATGFAGGEVRLAKQSRDEAVSVRNRGIVFDPRNRTFARTSGGGQHGLGIDNWGRKFLCSNVYPLQHLIYDTRYAARNRFLHAPAAGVDINAEGPQAKLSRISPLEPWRVERAKQVAADAADNEGASPGGRFTSSSGITVYRGDAWPPKYVGNLFVGEVANNLVYRARIVAKGFGVSARRAEQNGEFLASRDIWFRPVQFANGPDGNLYVVDMYRALIEGAAFVPRDALRKLNPARGIDRGRIYRVVWTAHKQKRSWPVKIAGTSEQLVSLLAHPNGWHRDTAARLLYQRRDSQLAGSLRPLAGHANPVARLHALYALQGTGQLAAADLLAALRDEHPHVRRHAVRLAETRLSMGDRTTSVADRSQLQERLSAMVDDGDAEVRLQLAFTVGRLDSAARQRAFLRLLRRDGSSKWMRLAIQSGLGRGAGDVFLAALRDRKLRATEGVRQFLAALAEQIARQNQNADIAMLMQATSELPPRRSTLRTELLTAFFRARDNRPPAGTDLKQSAALVRELVEQARAAARNQTLPLPKRVAAIRTLGLADFAASPTRTLFRELLDRKQPHPVQLAALAAMEKSHDPFVAELLIERWRTWSPRLRQAATEVLLSWTGSTTRFLTAIQRGEIAERNVSRSRLESLRRHPDADIRKLAARFAEPPSDRERMALLERYQPALTKTGDAKKGKAIFVAHCAGCHRLGDVGRSVGASLVGHRDAGALIGDILDPNRAVKPPFVVYTVRTNQGRLVVGQIVEETDAGLVVQRSDGRRVALLRREIDTLRSENQSFMPEGFEKRIDVAGMADLLTFLLQSR